MKKNSVKEYYNTGAAAYDQEFYVEESSYPTMRIRHNYIINMVNEIELPPDANILDIGCGPGEMVADLRAEGRKIWGIDISENMIKLAKSRINNHENQNCTVCLEVGDIEDLKFDDSYFDLIICSGVIEYLDNDVKWLREINRILKTNGYLIVNITNKYSIRKWTSPIVESLKSIKAMFVMMNYLKEKILKKGKLHHFPFSPRLHSPGKFNNLLRENGYYKMNHNYFDFAVLPAPFDTVLGIVITPVKKYLERHTRKNMIINGTGYIVAAKKTR